jgi:hypothetical protein
MMTKYAAELNLSLITCCNCFVVFAVMENHKKCLIDKGTKFYCPNGHVLWYGESNEEKIKRLQDDLAREKANHDQAKAELEKSKKVLQDHQRRTAHGVCPCCNRSFKALRAHMKRKHPEFVK